MRAALFVVLIVVLVALGLVGGCGYSGYGLVRDIFSNTMKLEGVNARVFGWCFNGLPFVDKLDRVFANKTFIVILQNNRELRPSGGFMGSYAVLTTQPTGLKSFDVQDIYVPDGQLVGHVDPPIPIQQAFGQGWWKLRDSNWDVDFPTAATQIAWFFDQGKVSVDGIVAVNLSLVNSILEVLGEVKTLDYSEKVTAASFYNLAQKYAESNFFPGSTQKRDFLSSVGNALVARMVNSTLKEKINLARLVWQELKRGEIVVWFKDPDFQLISRQRKWDGGLEDYSDNYLYIVETNLGANKANCCIGRTVTHEIRDDNQKLNIVYRNDNVFENPKPPHFWGGNYINYLRIVVPKKVVITSVKVGGRSLRAVDALTWQYGLQEDVYVVEQKDKHQVLGFWAPVAADASLDVEVNYEGAAGGSVVIQKQPGIGDLPYRLMVNGKTIVDRALDRSKELGRF